MLNVKIYTIRNPTWSGCTSPQPCQPPRVNPR